MPTRIHHLHRRFPPDILVHVVGNWDGNDDVVGGLDDGAWDEDLGEDVSVVAVEDGVGQGESDVVSHSSEAVSEFIGGKRVLGIDDQRGKGCSPLLVVGFYVGDHVIHYSALKSPFVTLCVDIPANIYVMYLLYTSWFNLKISKIKKLFGRWIKLVRLRKMLNIWMACL